MIKELGVQFQEIEPSAPDMPFSINSGAGVIFGVTGGVMEAALRHVADKNNEALREIEYSGVRGLEGTKIAEIELGGNTLRVGIVNGLGNADALIKKLQRGEEKLDFVEVMACPYGCIGGAGQPFGYRSVKQDRAQGMYKADKSAIADQPLRKRYVKGSRTRTAPCTLWQIIPANRLTFPSKIDMLLYTEMIYKT